MKSHCPRAGTVVAFLAIACWSVAELRAAPPIHLVDHTSQWHYRKGTNEPPADWHTVADATLDATWNTGPGGIGFADADDGTELLDMRNNYLTVYTRMTFNVADPVDPTLILQLTADYDDGYVAYLDGVEISRSSNVPATPHPYNSGVVPDHPAIVDGGALEVVSLGPVGDRLAPGDHILAVQGINGDIASSDVTLTVDLYLTAPAGDVTWTPDMNPVMVDTDVVMPAGTTLTVEAGTEVLVSNGASIRAQGGSIVLNGAPGNRVVIRSVDNSNWGRVAASGAGATLTVRHAEISQGATGVDNGATGLLEDSYFHHFFSTTPQIVYCDQAAGMTVRRCHVAFYHETLFRRTPLLVEDSLFENATNPSSDALDFDGVPPGSVIRQSTFRFGMQSNTDAIDIGPVGGANSIGVIIEDCIMHDFSDKGVSIGENSFGITVRNCLIYNVGSGVQVKDICTAAIHDCTILDSAIGLHGFEKTAGTGGGRLTNTFNNILFNNQAAIAVEVDTEIVVNYSDTVGTNWPGMGNINANPLFVNAAERDYRLQAGSPCLGTGQNGTDMGVTFPIGGLPAAPENLEIVSYAADELSLQWQDVSDKESGFVVEISTNATDWMIAMAVPQNAESATLTGLSDQAVYFCRVKGTNFIDASLSSNWVSTGGEPGDFDGDGMPDDWESAHDLDPKNPDDALDDSDNDGSLNRDEYAAGTDPQDPGSCFRILEVAQDGPGSVRLQFEAQEGKSYIVERAQATPTLTWETVTDVPAAEKRVFTISDTPFPPNRAWFYRIVTPTEAP